MTHPHPFERPDGAIWTCAELTVPEACKNKKRVHTRQQAKKVDETEEQKKKDVNDTTFM